MSLESDAAFHARQLFAQGAYSACISTIDSLGASVSPALRLYAARSHIALGAYSQATSIANSIDTPAGKAVKLLADHDQANGKDGGAAADEAFELLEELGQDADGTTRAIAGTILAGNEDYKQHAIEVLKAGAAAEDQECVALLIQIYLSLDRLDLAKSTYATAKTWAEDSLIIQLCEAWIGLKQGGQDEAPGYQAAFYCYDEISGMPSANSPVVLNGKAVTQAALHRWPEAEAPLAEAANINANDSTTLANTSAFSVLTGKPAEASQQALESLRRVAPQHVLLQDLAAKSSMFDEAAAKFSVSAKA
ncbi:hypothetical protein EMMF5_001841 [Cystobasidiomycetes sp. EMM_F5]